METNESSVVVEAEPDFVSKIEQELVARTETPAWLKELSSFATAMIVTSAAVVLGGVVALLFCYAFFITTPVALVALVIATARGARRDRVLAS